MVLRITVANDKPTVEIRLEGRLEAQGVPDLRESCRSASIPLRLDLSGLQSADKVGIDTLRSLHTEGVEFHGASLYVRQLLGIENP